MARMGLWLSKSLKKLKKPKDIVKGKAAWWGEDPRQAAFYGRGAEARFGAGFNKGIEL